MDASDDSSFVPIPNPYIVGNPIDDRRMFFGREDDFDYIRNKIAGERRGGLIVLCGARRSGKTSILFQIRRGRLGPDFLPVLIDMQSITVRGDVEFLAVLQQEIVATMQAAGIAWDGPPARGGANPHAAFQTFTDEVSARLNGRKLVVMFDEYELFETHIAKDRFSSDILNLLANWIEHRAGVFIVFTGSDKLEARDSGYWGHFLGKALHRRISFLSAADTRRLIEEPVRGQVEYASGIVEEIYGLTAGQPFYTQVICQTLVDRLNETRSRMVAKDELIAVVAEIIDNPLPQMIFSWSSLTGAEKVALSVIAELNRDTPAPVAPAEIAAFCQREDLPWRPEGAALQEALERLFYHDLLEKEPANDRYTFKMDLWRLWVARMHSIWQVIDEIRSGDARGEAAATAGGRRTGRRLGVVAAAAALPVLAVAVFLGTRLTQPPPAPPPSDGRAGAEAPADTTASAIAGAADAQPAPQPRLGGLRLVSQPAGATIFLNGEATGFVTPRMLDGLDADQPHAIELRLAGHAPGGWPRVRLLPDTVTTLTHRFARAVHSLSVVSTPRGARVLLDGAPVGQTPLNLARVEEGPHELVIEMRGYRQHRQRIEVPTPAPLVEAVLEKLPPGILVLQIEPYADVWIDGQLWSKDVVNSRVELEAGQHAVELRHPVHSAVTLDVDIRPGEETVVRQRMSQETRSP